MNSLEKKAKEIFIRFWDTISVPDGKGIKEALSLLDKDFRGYGTGQHEKFAGTEYMSWFLDEQAKQIPGGATYQIHELICRSVDDLYLRSVPKCRLNSSHQEDLFLWIQSVHLRS